MKKYKKSKFPVWKLKLIEKNFWWKWWSVDPDYQDYMLIKKLKMSYQEIQALPVEKYNLYRRMLIIENKVLEIERKKQEQKMNLKQKK